DGQRGRLVVRDHGMGIDPEDQTRIFERFERLAPGSQVSGFGLGLWIVRQIVDALAGTIGLDSRPGAGATFMVELPLGRLAAGGKPPSPRPPAIEPLPTTRRVEAASSDHSAGKVLIVEDDEDILEAVRQVLRCEGYDVAAATNGQEAIEYLRSATPPRVILLDLMMPVMDGGQFLRVLEQDRTLAAIPVVVVSADGQLRQKAEDLNVAGYLQKPVS